MQIPAIKIVRSHYTLTVENAQKFSQFPEACIRGALGYLLYDWANQFSNADNPFKAELCIRLYETLVGAFPNKEIEVREATPPKMGMLFVTKSPSAQNVFELELTLFGDNDDLLHLFSVALRRLGAEGIGREFIRYTVHSKIISQVGILSDFIKEFPQSLDALDVELSFYSPTTLKALGGFLLEDWDKEAFARNLYNRIELLCKALNVPYAPKYTLFEFVNVFTSLECCCLTSSAPRKRFSSRQHQRVDCSGFTGNVLIKQVPRPVLEMLLCGEQLAVGKNTTFGNGRYNLTTLQIGHSSSLCPRALQ